jgi:prefoldin subunit 5
MQKTIEERLNQLREEYQAGQQKLMELDSQRNAVRDTLLRISGAIQALEEMMGTDTGQPASESEKLEPVSVKVADA